MSNIKWTYDICEQESKKYECFSSFSSNSHLAYRKSVEKGWIKEFTWLKDDRGFYDETTKMYLVYKYVWDETNTIYIGLTKNLKERDRSHRKVLLKGGKEYKSSVKLYSEKSNLGIPKPIVIENSLNSIEARLKEDYWVKYYIELGFNVINRGKTGIKSGSLGGPIKKWNYDLCFKEAKKYKTRSEFQVGSYGAYRVAKNSGWLEEYDWMLPRIHPNGYWTEARCYCEAKKFEYWDDFRKKSHSAYDSAKNNGWLSQYEWLKLKVKPNGYWNRENCLKEAEKYKKYSEFRNNASGAYNSARINGWLIKIKEKYEVSRD